MKQEQTVFPLGKRFFLISIYKSGYGNLVMNNLRNSPIRIRFNYLIVNDLMFDIYLFV